VLDDGEEGKSWVKLGGGLERVWCPWVYPLKASQAQGRHEARGRLLVYEQGLFTLLLLVDSKALEVEEGMEVPQGPAQAWTLASCGVDDDEALLRLTRLLGDSPITPIASTPLDSSPSLSPYKTAQLCQELEAELSEKLRKLESVIPPRQPSLAPPGSHFLYFNATNLSLKALGGRGDGTVPALAAALSPATRAAINDMHAALTSGQSGTAIFSPAPGDVQQSATGELALRLSDTLWLAGQRFGDREVYVLVEGRKASIAETLGAVAKLRTTTLGAIVMG